MLDSLGGWAKDSLPEQFMHGSPQQSPIEREPIEREQLLLRVHYWSTKILITRPCLCRTERRIKNESDKSAQFNAKMSEVCVDSARALTALFPDNPNSDFVYKTAPWWSIVHISKCIVFAQL